jgi:hypothetical protein
MYGSGLSGEFITWALSQSLDNFAVGENHWEGARFKYTDAIGRSMYGGDSVIKVNEVLDRYRMFNENQSQAGEKHFVMLHPDPQNIQFVRENFNTCPMIEIVNRKLSSQTFQHLGRQKITQDDIKNSGASFIPNFGLKPYRKVYNALDHLEIEWEDLILTNTNQVLENVSKFVDGLIDVSIFNRLLNDYKKRNQSYLNSIKI